MIKKYIMSLIFAVNLGSCGPSNLPVSKSFTLDKFAGTWQSTDYGYLLSISEAGLGLYDINHVGCFIKPQPSHILAANMTFFKRISDDQISIAALKGSTNIVFSKFKEGIPKRCSDNRPVTQLSTFEYFVKLMEDHYAFFDLYQVNWQQEVKKMRDKISDQISDQALFDALTDMISELEDAHLTLKATFGPLSKKHKKGYSKYLHQALEDAFLAQDKFDNIGQFKQNWYENYKTNIHNEILSGEDYEHFNDQIIWGKIGNIGYINILAMSGFSNENYLSAEILAVKTAFNAIMAKLRTSDAIIIDITSNGGGDDELGRLFAAYFTKIPVMAYSKYPASNKKLSQEFYITPTKQNSFDGTVYLVTSDHTVSAAETFTLAMKALPNVIHIGETTRGALSDMLDKPLPNGWQFSLSNEVYLDANGKSWEGIGIIPDYHVSIFRGTDINISHLLALKKIINLVADKSIIKTMSSR